MLADDDDDDDDDCHLRPPDAMPC